MEIIESMQISGNNKGRERNELFQKIDGMVYCQNCGKDFRENEVNGNCPICKGEEFIGGDFAALLGGYLRLNKLGLLKKYYDNRFKKKSAVRMNDRRIVIQLLIDDGFVRIGNKKDEDIVRRAMWKKS